MLLKDKIAVISGAATRRGIGFATARLFAEHGATVAILDLAAQEPAKAAAELGPQHRGYVCDVTRKSECEAVAQRAITQFGNVDCLVNNAGITQPIRIMDVRPENYDAVMDVNLRGMLYLSQAFIPHMIGRKSGSIACTSSVSGQAGGGFFGGPHYSAAKAGMLGLMKDMAKELGPKGIRVNAVTPGMVDTDIRGDRMTPETFAKVLSGIPMGRIAHPSEVAGAFVFLASDLASFVTGAVIDVNGGMFIH